MNEELAYSIHLGSDKNKTAKAKEVAKNNPSGETSFSNNGIQNATQLSKVNKHNLRDYDNDKENIQIIYGTDNLYEDMQNLYFQEFEQARIEYNNKQTREDRKIKDYFKHISQDKQKDLACEFIIELGDMDFWNYKDDYYKRGMSQVYKEQVRDLIRIVPEFKVANAVIHFDETSPHMHIIGVPIKEDYKKGMRKQPAKSKVFTKESLQKIQDEMRICCIKSYNKVYCKNSLLKQKKKGKTPIIDLGCGSGNDTLYLIERGKKVIPCDYSKNAIENIKNNFPEIERAECFDMTKGLPFEDNLTDIIISDLSLHYFTEQKTFEILDEIKRVLKPNGLLFFRVNSINDVNYGAREEKKLNLTYMKQMMEDIKDFLMRKILQHSLQIGKNYIFTKKN